MNKKSILSILIVIILCVSAAYNYIYQEHRDIQSEQSNFVVTSQSISSEFSNTPTESETKYLNKTIEVSGIISELNENDLTLDGVVFCSFTNPINTSIKVNSNLKIKGRVIGYDDLLEQVKIDQCSLVTN